MERLGSGGGGVDGQQAGTFTFRSSYRSTNLLSFILSAKPCFVMIHYTPVKMGTQVILNVTIAFYGY